MIERAVIADLGGLADHHPHAVIDHHPPADPGSGMDLDAGEEAAEMGDEATEESRVVQPQPARRAMKQDGVQPRIAEQDFGRGAGGGIALSIGGDALPQEHEGHATNPL